jgi:hypothetical protein
MYIVRDIFHLKFGHYKDAKALMDEVVQKGLLKDMNNAHVLTDFTGDAYRLILESSFDSLAEYEQSLTGSMGQADWQQWYTKFKEQVDHGHREILKQVI